MFGYENSVSIDKRMDLISTDLILTSQTPKRVGELLQQPTFNECIMRSFPLIPNGFPNFKHIEFHNLVLLLSYPLST